MTVPLYQLSDVWGDPTQRFKAIGMNVQDGGHLQGSLLFDLQVNGVSQFSVDPAGVVLLLSDLKFFRDPTAPLPSIPTPGPSLALRNGAAPQGFRVYNTYTDDNNFERGGFTWLSLANTLAIGTSALGTGQGRPIIFQGTNFLVNQNDLGIFRSAPGVLEINNGSPGVRQACYLKWGGQARVLTDASFTSAMLASVPGLAVNVAAGRAYAFEVELSFTDVAAGGIKCAMAGTATATNIIYDGWIVDAANAGIKGNAQAAALGGVVASALTTGTAGHVTISGTIEVNAAGTLAVQAAQNTANATATVIKRGSRMIVHDVT
jgi:hypothetical protein